MATDRSTRMKAAEETYLETTRIARETPGMTWDRYQAIADEAWRAMLRAKNAIGRD